MIKKNAARKSKPQAKGAKSAKAKKSGKTGAAKKKALPPGKAGGSKFRAKRAGAGRERPAALRPLRARDAQHSPAGAMAEIERPLKTDKAQPHLPFTAAPGKKPDARATALLAAEAAFDKKAYDVLVLDVTGLSPIADYMVISSSRSSTHLLSVADNVEKELSTHGLKASGRERGRDGEPSWVLLDYFDVLIHGLTDSARAQYKLESLYPGAKIIAQFH